MTLRVGDELPSIEMIDADGAVWRTDAHREHGVGLVLILHRHLA